MKRLLGLLSITACATACGDDRPPPEVAREQPQRRVIEPPSGTVRPLPPYAILADGVGPYKLKQSVAALMDRLPKGPRIARFEIPGLLHAGLVRAEDDTVLIGTEVSPTGATGGTAFVAVIGSTVASMDSGLKVGSTIDEVKKQNPVADDPDRAHDPRIAVLASARNVRILTDNKRVSAIVLMAEPAMRELSQGECTRPASTATAFGACLSGAGELVEVDGDDVIVRSASSEKPIVRFAIPNLRFAVPLRGPDGRDEIIAIARTDDVRQRTWTIVGARLEGAQVKRTVDPTPLYQVTASQTRWIGAELGEVDLYLELANRGETIEVGGLLTTRSGDRIRDVVAISATTVTRRHHKPATPEPEPGAPGTGSGDASKGSHGSAKP